MGNAFMSFVRQAAKASGNCRGRTSGRRSADVSWRREVTEVGNMERLLADPKNLTGALGRIGFALSPQRSAWG